MESAKEINAQQINDLPWHVVEQAVSIEVDWLRQSLQSFKYSPVFDNRESHAYDDCICYYRQIALLIIRGKVTAREIKADNLGILWGSIKLDLPPKHHHGTSWHRSMMDAIERDFKKLDYEVIAEPHLNMGRADLGMFKPGFKDIYVEVGTVSIKKMAVNLQTMEDRIFLCIPNETTVIEFSISSTTHHTEETHHDFHPLKK